MRALIRRRKGAPLHAPWEDTGTRYEQASTARALAGKREHPGFEVWEVDAADVDRMTKGAKPAASTSASARPVARG